MDEIWDLRWETITVETYLVDFTVSSLILAGKGRGGGSTASKDPVPTFFLLVITIFDHFCANGFFSGMDGDNGIELTTNQQRI